MKKQFNMRIDEEILIKMSNIAEENERTLSQEISYTLKQRIKVWEIEHGEICVKVQC